jgi:pentatricopeptide repeat domain-containing protein 1
MYICSQQEIFHRDLKPENLLMTVNDELKIGDFGTANKISSEMSQDMTYRRCTPVYAAPEVYIL